MTPELAARKLSGALGRRIDPADVRVVYDGAEDGHDEVEIKLADGNFWMLWPGNKCIGGPANSDLRFFRNGKELTGDEWRNSKRAPEFD